MLLVWSDTEKAEGQMSDLNQAAARYGRPELTAEPVRRAPAREQLVRRAAGAQFIWERSAIYQWTFGLATLAFATSLLFVIVGVLTSGGRIACGGGR